MGCMHVNIYWWVECLHERPSQQASCHSRDHQLHIYRYSVFMALLLTLCSVSFFQDFQVIHPYISNNMDRYAFQSAHFNKHQEEPFFTCDPGSPLKMTSLKAPSKTNASRWTSPLHLNVICCSFLSKNIISYQSSGMSADLLWYASHTDNCAKGNSRVWSDVLRYCITSFEACSGWVEWNWHENLPTTSSTVISPKALDSKHTFTSWKISDSLFLADCSKNLCPV